MVRSYHLNGKFQIINVHIKAVTLCCRYILAKTFSKMTYTEKYIYILYHEGK